MTYTTETYPIASEYIADHGVSEINSLELFKAVIKQIIVAIPDMVKVHRDTMHYSRNVLIEVVSRP